jgi:hypothetical protein
MPCWMAAAWARTQQLSRCRAHRVSAGTCVPSKFNVLLAQSYALPSNCGVEGASDAEQRRSHLTKAASLPINTMQT